MTAVIGVRHSSNRIYLAADSRVSWGASPNYPCKDNLQKIYPLSSDIVVAICGDIEAARTCLREVRRWYEARGSRGQRSLGLMDRARLVKATLWSAWKEQQLTGRVYLLLGVSSPTQSEIYSWTSLTPRPETWRWAWNATPLSPGEVTVLGSVRNDADLVRRLEGKLRVFASTAVAKVDDLDALFVHTLVTFFAGAAGDRVQVGGLFQVASPEKGEFMANGYSVHRFGTGAAAPNYAVDLRHNPGGWWEQVDSNGNATRLETLDTVSLVAPRGLGQKFRY